MLWEHEPQDRNPENMFFISFRKHRNVKRKTTCQLCLSKCKFSLLAPSLRQQLVLALCFYRVMEARFLTNQPRILRTVF